MPTTFCSMQGFPIDIPPIFPKHSVILALSIQSLSSHHSRTCKRLINDMKSDVGEVIWLTLINYYLKSSNSHLHHPLRKDLINSSLMTLKHNKLDLQPYLKTGNSPFSFKKRSQMIHRSKY